MISPILRFFTLKKQNFIFFPLKNPDLQSSEKTGTPSSLCHIIMSHWWNKLILCLFHRSHSGICCTFGRLTSWFLNITTLTVLISTNDEPCIGTFLIWTFVTNLKVLSFNYKKLVNRQSHQQEATLGHINSWDAWRLCPQSICQPSTTINPPPLGWTDEHSLQETFC